MKHIMIAIVVYALGAALGYYLAPGTDEEWCPNNEETIKILELNEVLIDRVTQLEKLVAVPCPPCPEFDKQFFDHNRRSVGWDFWQCKVTPLAEVR